MSKAIKMLLVSIMLAVFCCVTTGAPMETTPSGAQSSSIHQLQDDACAHGPTPITTEAPMDLPISFLQTFTLKATDIRPVFLTRIENAVSVLISDIKSTTSSYGRSVFSAHFATMLSPFKYPLLLDSLEIHKDEIKSIVGNYFDSQLDLILDPAHEKFMREAANILEVSEQQATSGGDTHVRVWDVINDVLSALERVEQALKQEVIELFAKSVPDVLNWAGEVVADVVSDEASTSKYDACYQRILNDIFGPNHALDNYGQVRKTLVKAKFIEAIPSMIHRVYCSKDAKRVTAAAMVALDKCFGSSIFLEKLLCEC